MSIVDKVQTIKELVKLVCNVIPSIVEVIKLIVVSINDIKAS